MNTKGNNRGRSWTAFTLIEMLTVITIMGIIAALVVTMGQTASQKKKTTAVEGEKQKLITLINNYQAKLNYYPPDNGLLATLAVNMNNPVSFSNYDAMAATNPLLYELTGGSNNGAAGTLTVFNSSNASLTVAIQTYSNIFNRGGIGNGDAQEPHNFFQPLPSTKEYAPYNATVNPPICGLLVPADFMPGQTVNFWHYDSSTTNRHNMNSYDLWAEFDTTTLHGRVIMNTNGNW
jgi:prepilin-type N-terminal cleavage/methylation domain-containing protein